MDRDAFREHWPHIDEGREYSDQPEVYLIQSKKRGWIRELILGVIGYGGLYMAFQSTDPARVAAVLAAITFLYLVYIRGTIDSEMRALRVELAHVKGGIRENRHLLITRTAVAHKETKYDPLMFSDDD